MKSSRKQFCESQRSVIDNSPPHPFTLSPSHPFIFIFALADKESIIASDRGVDLNTIQRGTAEAALLPAMRMKRKD